MNTSKVKTYKVYCPTCNGKGKKRRKVSKKSLLRYEIALEKFNSNEKLLNKPIKPKGELYACSNCNGTGLIASNKQPLPNFEKHPHIAIIGGGIGGVALAVACLHRNIPFTLFERDATFNSRAQGYGLTLQQASKVMANLGIDTLEKAVISTKHIVFSNDGKIIGEWGMRKWLHEEEKTNKKRTNKHIARQALRLALLEQLGSSENIFWNYQLLDFEKTEEGKVKLTFKVNNEVKHFETDIVVGADGIRSAVRNILFKENYKPLRYLDCIVILGICPLTSLQNVSSNLLNSETVFQTANGNERIYMMPFNTNSIMWQLSFPISENEAIALSNRGAIALKEEAFQRLKNWHSPIPEIIDATIETQISGYPVYDRELLHVDDLQQDENVTLIGDAAHPMSPFKGQGANQAIIDALELAKTIKKNNNWKENGIRNSILNPFEIEMLKRSAIKVKDSATAAKFLHNEAFLLEGNVTRGKNNNKRLK